MTKVKKISLNDKAMVQLKRLLFMTGHMRTQMLKNAVTTYAGDVKIVFHFQNGEVKKVTSPTMTQKELEKYAQPIIEQVGKISYLPL